MAVNMAKQDNKATILSVLKQQAAPVSLREISEQLGGQIVERTLRRKLRELVDAGLVRRIGQKRATQYQYIEIENLEPAQSLEGFSDTSVRALQYVRKPLFERGAVAYNKDWLGDYQPNKDYYFTQTERETLLQYGQPSFPQAPAGSYAKLIYNRLLIDLSYNSSRLEGNTYSLLDTQKLVLEGVANKTKLDEERIMILNHKEAICYLVDNAHRLEIAFNEICTIHYLLSDGLVLNQFAGKLRDHAVRIGMSTCVTLEGVEQLTRQLGLVCGKASMIRDPYEQSFFLLVHLAYLQAFSDVNKRTSRLCANIPLLAHNLIPISFNEVDKDNYISAMLAVYELNEVRPLAELYSASYIRSCYSYNATAEVVGYDTIRVQYRAERRDILRHVILHQIVEPAIEHYIETQAQVLVKGEDRQAFIEDIYEDIENIDVSRLAGLGVTKEQLADWQKLINKN